MIDKKTGMSAKESMGEEIATLAARIDAATYELLVLIRKFDEREGWNNGFLSCAHWLTWRIGLAPSAARERVRVARALGDLPLMSEAPAKRPWAREHPTAPGSAPPTFLFPRKQHVASPATPGRSG